MFGLYKTPVSITREGLSITLNEGNEYSLYRRASSDGIAEKILMEVPEGIILNPVEPVNIPKKISPYLAIGFSTTVVVRPHSTKAIFLKFPVEVGVFLPREDEHDLLDIISLSRKKYTLYGTPRGGHVCRFWQSDVFASVPEIDLLYEGVLKLEIRNEADEWVPVKKAVFDVHGMKIYYDESVVSARAKMTVTSGNKAESEFIDAPLEVGMQNSIELIQLGKISVASSRYYMGEGL